MLRYVVGIDLGTTHSAVAVSPVGRAEVTLFDIPQLVAPGEVAARPLLPSFLYLPAEGELPENELTLPWGREPSLVGELARRLGAQVPGRLVSSAKSWICNGGVDRKAPILPWSAPDEAPHVSPFEASVAYLAHLRAAWDAAHPDAPLAEQDVVVTVPASFDEVARELTLEAAREAGLGPVRLLEEPQAAFYDFVGAHRHDLAEVLTEARLVLVVDVGGGTTDLTLVRVHPPDETSEGRPKLERIAVGGHLLLGGDNMDAALAHHVLQTARIDARLDPTEWSALVQATRRAKEALLAEDAPDSAVVSVTRRGSKLIGGTRSIPLTREDVRKVLLDGFLPHTARDEVAGPAGAAGARGRAGLTTLGLPYATDPAIPRHISTFLRRHAQAAAEAGAEVVDGLPRPDLLLLNGGVFNGPALVERLSEVLAGWYGAPVPLLEHTSLDTAVARGAAWYALFRRGFGQVITGGTARAYYVGVEGPGGAQRAFCIAPRGLDEGATVEVKDRVFELVLDRPVAFPLYAYTGQRADPAGALIDVDEELEPLPPIETVLRPQGGALMTGEQGGVPVTLAATLNQAGTLELYLVTVELPPRRWRLEFALQGQAQPAPGSEAPAPEEAPLGPPHKAWPEARRMIERVYSPGKVGADPQKAKALRSDVERALGPRGEWSAATCRALWDTCMTAAPHRGRSALHELTWLRLVGWALRPGFGAQGDTQRIRRMWALHAEGIHHPNDKAIWTEWWILWRRVAPGLDRAQQATLFEAVRPWLTGGKPPPGPRAHGHNEMVQMLAALERLTPTQKEQAGAWFLERADKLNNWWPLGRLGAREPFHGDPADVVPPTTAESWLHRLLALDWKKADGAAFAAALLARMTGDEQRDIDPTLRKTVLERLADASAPATWIDMVTRATGLSAGDAKRVYGESLPAGLRLA